MDNLAMAMARSHINDLWRSADRDRRFRVRRPIRAASAARSARAEYDLVCSRRLARGEL